MKFKIFYSKFALMKYKHKITGDIATLKSNNSSFYTYDGMDIHARIIENSNDWEKVETETEYFKLVKDLAKYFGCTFVIEETQPPTKEEIMQECIKRFPKGSRVRCTNDGKIYTVAKKQWTEPEENNWFEGIYYYGFNDSIHAMVEGETRGFCLFNKGTYSELVKEPQQDWLQLTIKNDFVQIRYNNKGEPTYRSDENVLLKNTLTLKDALKRRINNISSIQLTNLTSFCIGDKTQNGIITYLNLRDDDFKPVVTAVYKTKEGGDTEYKLKDAVLEKDTYSVHVKGFRVLKNYKVNECNLHDWKIFSIKEAAEEYILLNKPCLSISEILDFLEGNPKLGSEANWIYNKTTKFTTDKLKELVKSKNK